MLMPYDSTVIASVRYVGAVHAKIEFLLPGEEQARQFATQAGTFLEMFKSVESSLHASGSDPDVKAVFESLKVQQEKDHAILSASIPRDFSGSFFQSRYLRLISKKNRPSPSLRRSSVDATPKTQRIARPTRHRPRAASFLFQMSSGASRNPAGILD